MMNDKTDRQENEPSEESFEQLLSQYAQGLEQHLQVGDRISGKIIAVGADTAFVDTGTKVDGIVDRAELLDDRGELTCQPGDRIDLYVVSVRDDEIRLSKALAGVGGLDMLREAQLGGIPVQGKVLATCKGGFQVEVLQHKAFCPISQIDVKHVASPEDYVGNTHTFEILRIEENGRNIVLSRRKRLEREQQETAAAFLKTLSTGAVLEGRVTRVEGFGVFVELAPGVEGLVHVSELSWSRVEKPQDRFRVGDPLPVKVIGIQTDAEGPRQRISLSVKQLSGDPWESVGQRFRIGDKIKGTVTRCAPFGAFVEVSPGIEGLVHISEMSYRERIIKPEDRVSPGDAVQVTVKDIDPDHRRISLSIRDAEGDPWIAAADNYRPGQVVAGVVEKKEPFGIFVRLEPGVTGLLPKARVRQAADAAAIEKLKPGDPITVVVQEVLARERKMSLSPGELAESADWRSYSPANSAKLGVMAEKLQAAMKAKKPT